MINQISIHYRPKCFADVIEQTVTVKTLQNRLRENSIHHAYIFSGLHGCGKTSLARIFARTLNCKEENAIEPCEKCVACLDKRNRDIIEFDAASHTGVDDIRETILSSIDNYPIRDKYRIFVIDEVHSLSVSAFNAMLKVLEEPPYYVIFMLATTEVHKLPKTIQSRCQKFQLKQISLPAIEASLRKICQVENIEIDEGSIYTLGHAANGSLRDAQTALEKVTSYAGNQITVKATEEALGLPNASLLFQAIKYIADKDTDSLISLTGFIEEQGIDFAVFVNDLANYLRDVMVCKFGSPINQLYRDEFEKGQIYILSSFFTENDCIRLSEMLLSSIRRFKNSGNPKFELELLFAKLCAVAQVADFEETRQKLLEIFEVLKEKELIN